MLTGILGTVLVLFFMLVEGRTRHGVNAASLQRGAEDRGSTVFVGAPHGAAVLIVLVSPALDYFGIAVLPFAGIVGWAGLVIEVAGIGLRFWSNRVLGQYYTRTLRVTESQTVVRAGPYAKIRHPGYLGAIAMWLGAALATTNWVAVIVIAIFMLAAYAYRIRSEEAMLAEKIGEPYRVYQRETWRMVPFVF